MKMALIALIAKSFLNSYYIYGANGSFWENGTHYRAFDCGSYVQKILQESNIINDRIDRSAKMIYDYLLHSGIAKKGGLEPLSILFFGKSTNKISHIAINMDNEYMIHCASGDSTTINIKEAIKRDARVKISKISSRKDLVASIVLDI